MGKRTGRTRKTKVTDLRKDAKMSGQITAGRVATDDERALVAAGRELVDVGGTLYGSVVHCGTCGYISPGSWRAPLRCPSCAISGTSPAPVMGELLMTCDEYTEGVKAYVASLAA